MRRWLNIVLLIAMIVGAVVTYGMKHDAEVAAADVARLNGEIADERDRITLLRAELSMLSQPARLQAVVDEHADYFGFVPFTPDHIGTINEIPLRPPEATEPKARVADADGVAALIRLASP